MSRPDSSKATKAGKHKLFCDLRSDHLFGIKLYFSKNKESYVTSTKSTYVRPYGGEVTKLELVTLT